VFDEETLPAGLRASHSTNAGVWGRIRVTEGRLSLTYVEARSEILLEAGQSGVVAPEQVHFVTPLGPMKMQVDFYSERPEG
jgi:tellurite resistance-related uncharacterized protein